MTRQFPSKKGNQVLRLLKKLGYTVTRTTGSHRKLEADGRPTIFFAWHDSADVSPTALRKLLVEQVGLNDDEIARVL